MEQGSAVTCTARGLVRSLRSNDTATSLYFRGHGIHQSFTVLSSTFWTCHTHLPQKPQAIQPRVPETKNTVDLKNSEENGGDASIQTRDVRRVQPQSAPERNPSVEGTAWARQRELPYSDSAARESRSSTPSVAISLSRLLLFGWSGRPSPSWSPLFGGRQSAAELDFRRAQYLGKVATWCPQVVFSPQAHAGHMIDSGIVLLSRPIPGSLSEQVSHLPYTPRDRLR